MSELKKITAIILTYKTPKDIILNCIKSLSREIKIIIVENSKNFEHQKLLKKKFPKIKIFCTGKNLGYGKGNNFGLSKTKTDYALILNPDIICDKNFFKNLTKIIKNNTNFDIIGCQYIKDKIFAPAGFFEPKKNVEFKKEYFENKIDNPKFFIWSNNFSDLEKLPGVGHKTASVVMSQGFGIPAFAVDTHIHRLAQRWGLTNGKSVKKTEEDLKKIFPKESWNKLHLQIIFWGREYCMARACHGIECKICKSCYPKRKRPFVHKRP